MIAVSDTEMAFFDNVSFVLTPIKIAMELEHEKEETKLEQGSPEVLAKMEVAIPNSDFGKLSLVQPNSVTNARYDFTSVQENILTWMIGAIQKHMTKEMPLACDLFGNPYFRLVCSEVAKGNTKHYVWKQLTTMRTKAFEFAYTNAQGNTEKVNTALIGAFRSVENTDFIDVEISSWALPYLIYWGKGVGGTIFNRTIALTLKGVYAKRMYKLCKRWDDKGGFTIPLLEFRKTVQIENKYERPAEIMKYVLDPAQAELNQCADVTFQYGFVKTKGRKFDRINFKIFGTKKTSGQFDWYSFVYRFITKTFPSVKDNKARICVDMIHDTGRLQDAYNRFVKLDAELQSKEKKEDDIIRLTKHILSEDYNISFDGTKPKKVKSKKEKVAAPGNEPGQQAIKYTVSKHWDSVGKETQSRTNDIKSIKDFLPGPNS
jgi:hypothetical protein